MLDVGTIISGKQLVVHYIADPSSFSTFLPTALKIINSLRIDKAAIERLTPAQSSQQSTAGGPSSEQSQENAKNIPGISSTPPSTFTNNTINVHMNTQI